MAREVTHTESGPRKLDAEDIDDEEGDIAVCQCGISAEYPFCDGSHRATSDEDPETTYRYERTEEGMNRRVVSGIVYEDEDGDTDEAE